MRPWICVLFSGAVGLTLAASGDQIAVGGTQYGEVYVREGVNRVYIQIPDTGAVISAAKEEVQPGSLILTSDPAARDRLLRRWRERRGEAPAAGVDRSFFTPGSSSPAASVHGDASLPKVLRLKGNASERRFDASGEGGNCVAGVHLREVPLKEALHAVLRPLNFDFGIRDNHVYISTPGRLRGESWERTHTRAYHPRNLSEDMLPKIVLRNRVPGGETPALGTANRTGYFSGGDYEGGRGGRGAGGQNTYAGRGYGGYGGGYAGGGYAPDVTIIGNISDLFSTIDDRMVGEYGPIMLAPPGRAGR